MSYTIAVAGKGGTGKTTIASFIVDYLARSNAGPVLAVDADPNSNLGEFLGLGITETLVGIIDDIAADKDKKNSASMTKARLIEYKLQGAVTEASGFDILAMGRPEGPGCYCYPNSMLREALGKLARAYKYIVIDNEAGMEHLSRRTMRSIDYLFITSDPTEPGLRAAKRILELVRELKISVGKRHLIINKSKSDIPSLKYRMEELAVDYTDYLPDSEEIFKLSKEGRVLTEVDRSCEFSKKMDSILEGASKRWH